MTTGEISANCRSLDDKPRTGGYGIYYHFDYVGDPRNYKWLNTNPIPRVWEQMHLAYEYGADHIWIVNVGDLKPMEFPISFFLDYAWDTKKWNAGNIADYTRVWSAQIFGKQYAMQIGGNIVGLHQIQQPQKTGIVDRRIPIASLTTSEAETIEADYDRLAEKAEIIYAKIPDEYRNAYYQLVLYPVKACANLNKLYVAAARNRFYAAQGRASANDEADSVIKYFEEDASLAKYYNTILSDGKWNHMMDQTHIGYTYWQQPEKNVMPEISRIHLPDSATMGLAIEGSATSWPDETSEALLPEFDSFLQQSHYIELFNRGKLPFNYSVKTSVPWVTVKRSMPDTKSIDKFWRLEKQERLWIGVEWGKIPPGTQKVSITITGPAEKTVTVFVVIKNYGSTKKESFNGFVETNGYVSIEASHFTRAINKPPVSWLQIPGIGRTGSGMTIMPVTAERQTPGATCPRLEYSLLIFDTGRANVQTYFSPTLNFNGRELQYGLSIDEEQPRIVNLHTDLSNKSWEQWVANNIIIDSSVFHVRKPGMHTLKFWMVDPGIVLQKIVVGFREIAPDYLGPPETRAE